MGLPDPAAAELVERALGGLADIALCSVMRVALLRCEEAAALGWRDIAGEPDGSGRLAVRRAKNDQEANGTLLYLGVESHISPWDRQVFGPDYPVTYWVGNRNSSGEVSSLAPWYAYRKP